MREQFKTVNFRTASLVLIETANEIIDDFMGQGLRLTLRQLYYQFVSKDLIPNTNQSYKNLGNTISQARLAGLIDWDAIEDRIRVPKRPPEFNDLDELISAAFQSYRLPRLVGQDVYCELWVEKDALAGVLAPLASKYHATLMVNRGYSSQSAMYEAAQRIEDERVRNLADRAMIFYLGDLDPSGEDMVRDIGDRLTMFGIDVEVEKVAITIEQVEEYGPPPNSAKLSDSRAKAFIKKYGRSSWEVDALPPTILREIIVDAFEGVLDLDKMGWIVEIEEKDKKKLKVALAKAKRESK